MYCRSRPQYRSDLGWISGVAFLGTLTRSARPVQGFTFVRCCSMPPASSPHGLAAPGLGRLTTAIPACSCLQLAVATNSLRRGPSPPIQCPCLAHQGRALRVAAKKRPSLTATARDRERCLWSGRRNGLRSNKGMNHEAMGTLLMRQRDASWEHSSVRQHGFSP